VAKTAAKAKKAAVAKPERAKPRKEATGKPEERTGPAYWLFKTEL
jgi:hypothetical protein